MSLEFSRRDFLKLSLLFGSSIGLKLAYIPLEYRKLGNELEPYILNTEKANFFLFTGAHGNGKTKHDNLPVNYITHLKPEAVFLEGGRLPVGTQHDTSFSMLPEQFDQMFAKGTWYDDLLPELKRGRIPIIFGDIEPAEFLEGAALELVKMAASVTPAFIGSEVISRKQFLVKSVGYLTSLWGFTGLGAEVIRAGLQDMPIGSLSETLRETAGFIELSHPESTWINFRNTLISKKLLFYAKHKSDQVQKKLNIVVIMGSLHRLLSEYLKRGDQFCKNYLEIYPSSFLENHFGKENLQKYYATLVELKFNGSNFSVNILKDPDLIV